YKVLVKETFERCLESKWSLGDCVAGCHNDFYTEKDSSHRNPHQRRLSKEMVAKLSAALENATDFPDSPADFEEIYEWVGNHVESVRESLKSAVYDDSEDSDDYEGIESLKVLSNDICPLLKYDTALRMAYNMAGADGKMIPPEENYCLPRRLVYLQCGARRGAQALLKITLLSRKEAELFPEKNRKNILKEYLNLESEESLKKSPAVEILKFHPVLQSLGSYHLENFLCDYHRLFEYWAAGYEISVNKLAEEKKITKK
ncbi:MAG: hypothetical protein K2N88_01290, partial [Muribaculaceae bacterium]|nr:hypothetical protein [Muribaculaceae bacterium]